MTIQSLALKKRPIESMGLFLCLWLGTRTRSCRSKCRRSASLQHYFNNLEIILQTQAALHDMLRYHLLFFISVFALTQYVRTRISYQEVTERNIFVVIPAMAFCLLTNHHLKTRQKKSKKEKPLSNRIIIPRYTYVRAEHSVIVRIAATSLPSSHFSISRFFAVDILLFFPS